MLVNQGIAQIATRAGVPDVVARCALMLLDEGREVIAQGSTAGSIRRGAKGLRLGPVLEADGLARTYAEFGDEVRDRIGHRGCA